MGKKIQKIYQNLFEKIKNINFFEKIKNFKQNPSEKRLKAWQDLAVVAARKRGRNKAGPALLHETPTCGEVHVLSEGGKPRKRRKLALDCSDDSNKDLILAVEKNNEIIARQETLIRALKRKNEDEEQIYQETKKKLQEQLNLQSLLKQENKSTIEALNMQRNKRSFKKKNIDVLLSMFV